jgi:hypothetical protein
MQAPNSSTTHYLFGIVFCLTFFFGQLIADPFLGTIHVSWDLIWPDSKLPYPSPE